MKNIGLKYGLLHLAKESTELAISLSFESSLLFEYISNSVTAMDLLMSLRY